MYLPGAELNSKNIVFVIKFMVLDITWRKNFIHYL